MNQDLEASMRRHPAGKQMVPCPACDGRGRIGKTLATAIVALLVGKMPSTPTG